MVGKLYLSTQQGKFLGNLDDQRVDNDSISNQFGDYGSRFSDLSILNPFGEYGGQFGRESPNNQFCDKPPRIVSETKGAIALLSCNKLLKFEQLPLLPPEQLAEFVERLTGQVIDIKR